VCACLDLEKDHHGPDDHEQGDCEHYEEANAASGLSDWESVGEVEIEQRN
jgi:hypothetical protein